MICVTVALSEESSGFLAALENRRYLERGRLPIIAGFHDGIEVAVGHTGIGFDACRLYLEKLIAHAPPRLLISSGFAGGLDAGMRAGDVVLSENFSDADLLAQAREVLRADRRVFAGRTTSKPQVVELADDKRVLSQQTRALAVDMESAVVREVCREHQIPLLVIRGISDSVRMSLPLPFQVWFDLPRQQPRPVAIAAYLLRNPQTIKPFVHFARQLKRTRAHLTRCLIQLVEQLG